ncbi:hypothetical protein B4140_3152 [Bacillus amyloliquefaciens]|nr:hypothetical protein B4140_3152 [Bacillus amyloliquefaciens]
MAGAKRHRPGRSRSKDRIKSLRVSGGFLLIAVYSLALHL